MQTKLIRRMKRAVQRFRHSVFGMENRYKALSTPEIFDRIYTEGHGDTMTMGGQHPARVHTMKRSSKPTSVRYQRSLHSMRTIRSSTSAAETLKSGVAFCPLPGATSPATYLRSSFNRTGQNSQRLILSFKD